MKRTLRSIAIVVVSVCVIALAYGVGTAGTLTPPVGVISGTLVSLSDVFASLASGGYDSSSVAAAKHGSALEISKCIIAHLQGSATCP